MGLAAASQHTGDVETKKKESAWKPSFLTKEELAAKKWLEEWKNKVVKQSTVGIGEHLTAITRHAGQYTQEIHALRFFEPDHATLACQVLAIVDWAVELNELSTHPLPEIPAFLESLYFGPWQARGQFPLKLPSAESGVMDVWTRSEALWLYLCTLLQYWEDEAAILEG